MHRPSDRGERGPGRECFDIDAKGILWIPAYASAADAVYAYDEAASRFTIYPLPSRGALVRHLAIDPRSRDLWIAYGASPGRIPAKIARLQLGSDAGGR